MVNPRTTTKHGLCAMQYLDYLTRKNIIITILISSLMLLVFVADLQFTTEVFVSALYLIVIMCSLWLPTSKYTICFAIICTILTTIGYFSSIYKIDLKNYLTVTSFVNLSMLISVIWITAFIAIYIKNISTALSEKETIHRSILEASIDPIVLIDQDGLIESASSALETTFGWSSQEIKGKRFTKLLTSNYRDTYANLFKSQANAKNSSLIGKIQEVTGQHRMKRDFPCELSFNYIYIPELDKPLFTAVLRDISVRKSSEQKMVWLSTHDELTKIYNRRYFNEQINSEWKRLLRTQESLAIIIIDVDFFKNYNDYLGHQIGDMCLQTIAANLNLVGRRSTDFVARYGGEEFIVLLPNTNLSGAIQVAENLQNQIRSLTIPHPKSACSKKVTVSMGIAAIIPSLGCTYERLIRFADHALYKAKESGRNRYCTYDD